MARATTNRPSARPLGRQIGYARVSTDEQATEAQEIELRSAGCDVIVQEQGSGASRARPALSRLVNGIGAGDVLVVVRLDRLARSVSHLLEVIEDLTAKGAHFRSLRDPIDTSTPQGMFSLQILGAVAQLERALISERTKAGIRATMDEWLPTVRRLRPDHPWEDVVRMLRQKGQAWTPERLRRATKWLVKEHLADATLLKKSPPRLPEDRLTTLVAGISASNPDLSLREIATQLERLHERTPRGGAKWSASSVKNLLDRARRLGLVAPDPVPGSLPGNH